MHYYYLQGMKWKQMEDGVSLVSVPDQRLDKLPLGVSVLVYVTGRNVFKPIVQLAACCTTAIQIVRRWNRRELVYGMFQCKYFASCLFDNIFLRSQRIHDVYNVITFDIGA